VTADAVVLVRLDDDEPLTAADVAALTRLDHSLPGRGEPGHDDPDDEVPGGCPPGSWADGRRPSGGDEAWPDDPSSFYGEPVARGPRPDVPESLDAGFTHRRGRGGTGFAAGGRLDRMPACADLATAADQTWRRGLGELSDDELAGLMGAQRRIDGPKAAVFAGELIALDNLPAAAIAGLVIGDAPGVTTGQLRRALRREVIAFDPGAAARRRQRAEKEARV